MLEVMLDDNKQFNPPSPVSAIKIEEGEILIAIEVHVTPKETDGDFKQETPYKVLFTDITYIFYGNGKRAFLSIIIDGSTNEVLAHQLYEKIKLNIVLGTLEVKEELSGSFDEGCLHPLRSRCSLHEPYLPQTSKAYEVRSVNVL